MYEDVVKGHSRSFGPDHPNTLNSLGNLAKVLANMGRLDEVKTIYEDVVKGQTKSLGPDHPDTVNSLGNLAKLLTDMGGALLLSSPVAPAAPTTGGAKDLQVLNYHAKSPQLFDTTQE